MAGTPLFGSFEGFDHFDDFLRKSFGGQPAANATATAPPTFDDQVRSNASRLKYSAGSGAVESAAAPAAAAAPEVAATVEAAPGFLARTVPTFAKAAGYGAKMLGPIATAAVPAVEGYGVYDKATDPNASKIDVATQAAEGTSRAAGAFAGARMGASIGGPPLLRGILGAVGGLGGYLAPNGIFGVRDMVRNAGGAPAATPAAVAAPVTEVAPAAAQVAAAGTVPETPIVSSYGAPPVVSAQPGTIAPTAATPAIGPNAFGIPAGNVSGNSVVPVKSADGSTVYTNFGAKPAAAVAPVASAGPQINPATGLPYSSTIVPGNPTGGNPADIISYLGNVRNYVAARGAERELEKRDLGTKAVRVAEIKAKSDIDKIREAEHGKPQILPNAAGGSTLIHPGSNTFYKTDSSGTITVGKIGGALPSFSETSVKSIAAQVRQSNPSATPSQIRAKLQELYKDKDIPASWIK